MPQNQSGSSRVTQVAQDFSDHDKQMIGHLFGRWIDTGLVIGDIERAGGNSANRRSRMCDLLSHRLAILFVAGKMSCDGGLRAMNNLIVVCNTNLSAFSWSVFEAFAAGVHELPSLPNYFDPVRRFAFPLLRQTLKRYRSRTRRDSGRLPRSTHAPR